MISLEGGETNASAALDAKHTIIREASRYTQPSHYPLSPRSSAKFQRQKVLLAVRSEATKVLEKLRNTKVSEARRGECAAD